MKRLHTAFILKQRSIYHQQLQLLYDECVIIGPRLGSNLIAGCRETQYSQGKPAHYTDRGLGDREWTINESKPATNHCTSSTFHRNLRNVCDDQEYVILSMVGM